MDEGYGKDYSGVDLKGEPVILHNNNNNVSKWH